MKYPREELHNKMKYVLEYLIILNKFGEKEFEIMKKLLLICSLLSFISINVNAQGIGELAPEKEPEVFPNNAFGIDILFSEGGFGLGAFYRRQITPAFTVFSDFSISESKDEREFDVYDYFGTPITIGKKNRIFIIPVNLGVQYRLFRKSITDNLRPYLNAGVGPTISIITPYELEFFESFGKAKMKPAFGSYIGIGANFGLDKSSLLGINLRYYFIHFFDEGVESLYDRYKKNIGGFFVTINIGMMY